MTLLVHKNLFRKQFLHLTYIGFCIENKNICFTAEVADIIKDYDLVSYIIAISAS